MDPAAALARVRDLLAAWKGKLHVDLDDLGDVLVYARRDLHHLDADALNDRLHAWAERTVSPELPAASAFVSFRHARPATTDEATLDVEELWLDLEPTFRLDLHHPRATPRDLEAFARHVPRFLELLDASGRPPGWRRVDEGNAE